MLKAGLIRMLTGCQGAASCLSQSCHTKHSTSACSRVLAACSRSSDLPSLHRWQPEHTSLCAAVFQGHLGRPQLFGSRPSGSTAATARNTRWSSTGHSHNHLAQSMIANSSSQHSSKAQDQDNPSTSTVQTGLQVLQSDPRLAHTTSLQSPQQQQPEAVTQAARTEAAAAAQTEAPPPPWQDSRSPQQQQPEAATQAAGTEAAATHLQAHSPGQTTGSFNSPTRPPRRRQTTTSSSRTAGSNGKGSSSSSSSSSNGSSSSSNGSSSSSNGSSTASPTTAHVVSEPNMALRSAFVSQQRPLQPPPRPVSPDVLRWAQAHLGITEEALKQWGAGMDTVKHPLTQQEIEVLALPYYRQGGQLVDVRYLHIHLADGTLLGSWLANQACEPFMREEHFKYDDGVVDIPRWVAFVSSELDALLVSSKRPGWPVVALTQQTPYWHPTLQEQQQQQQAEDPRVRLLQLQEDLQKRRKEAELGLMRRAMTAASPAHTTTTATTSSSSSSSHASPAPPYSAAVDGDAVELAGGITGLQLLLNLPAADKECVAVIALQEGLPGGHLLSESLSELLGPVHCRQAAWHFPYSSPQHLLDSMQEEADLARAEAADYMQGSSDSIDVECQGDQASAEQLKKAADDTAAAAADAKQKAAQLEQVFGPGMLSGWGLTSLAVLCGGDKLVACLEEATVWPIPGLERFADYAVEIARYWDTNDEAQLAHSTGWPSLDDYYKVAPGEVTVVTGVPNSGKSEWLDALTINLAEQQGWRFAVCSMEKRPRDHARQLIEKRAQKPLLQASYAEAVERMTEEELKEAFMWLREHYYVITPGEGNMPTISWVLDKARAAKFMHNINGLIIDPYNELDATRHGGLKEHEHVNATMALLRKFAREHQVAVWLVAHPRQLGNMWSGQRPGLQDISGGANFSNKADNGVVVHRDWGKLKELQERRAAAAAGGAAGTAKDKQTSGGSKRRRQRSSSSSKGAEGDDDGADGAEGSSGATGQVVPDEEFEVQIFIEKVRNKTTGSRGECVLYYDRVTGRYQDPRQDFMDAPQGPNDQQQRQANTRQQLPPAQQQRQQFASARQYSSAANSGSGVGTSSSVNSAAGPLQPTEDPEDVARWEEENAAAEAFMHKASRSSTGAGDGEDDNEEANLQSASEAVADGY